ncbi:MAG: MFS transporter [Taibaiella sp.]|nr:MFS transporter [Taibaiella sp.]
MKQIGRIYIHSFKGLSIESWMLSIVMLINRTGSMVLPFLGVYMTDHLGFSLKESGVVLSCFGIGSVAGSWIGGYITDKMGEYPIQAFSLFVSVPMFCLYPLFTTPASLAVMVLAQSIISELFRPANAVAITKYARPENLTRAFSLNRMAINLGFSIGPATAGLLAAVSYDLLFYVNALAALIAGIVYIYFFRKRQRLFKLRQARQKAHMSRSEIPPLGRSAYLDIYFWIFCLLCTAFAVCFFQLMNTLPIFYKDGIGLSKTYIGLLLGMNGLVVVALEMLIVHFAEQKLKLSQTMLWGTILCAASYFILIFYPDLIWLMISISLLSIGEILVLPFMATITALRASAHNKGTYMGINGMAVAIAFIISPLLGTDTANLYGFSSLWTMTTILLLFTAFGFYFFIPLLTRKKFV